MKKIIKKIPSPLFKDKYLDLIIWEPKKINKNTPTIFIYDGQILKTEEKEFYEKDGIQIFNQTQKVLGNCIIISINSMHKKDQNKYEKRTMELRNYKNGDYVFMKLIRKEITLLKKIYPGYWCGIGFSLSGWLIGKENIFDLNIMISPGGIKNDVYKLNPRTIVFFGSKEYWFSSNKRINKPILKLQTQNPAIKFLELKKMKHTFKSWNKHMPFILKESFAPYLQLKNKEL